MKKTLTLLLIASFILPVPAMAFDINAASPFLKAVIVNVAGQTFGAIAKNVWHSISPPSEDDVDLSYAEQRNHDAEEMIATFDELVAAYPDDQREQAKEQLRVRFSELYVETSDVPERLSMLRAEMAGNTTPSF